MLINDLTISHQAILSLLACQYGGQMLRHQRAIEFKLGVIQRRNQGVHIRRLFQPVIQRLLVINTGRQLFLMRKERGIPGRINHCLIATNLAVGDPAHENRASIMRICTVDKLVPRAHFDSRVPFIGNDARQNPQGEYAGKGGYQQRSCFYKTFATETRPVASDRDIQRRHLAFMQPMRCRDIQLIRATRLGLGLDTLLHVLARP